MRNGFTTLSMQIGRNSLAPVSNRASSVVNCHPIFSGQKERQLSGGGGDAKRRKKKRED